MPPALHTQPDHLVVTAATLEQGMHWVEQQLGVTMQPRVGGQHARLGTWNALLGLGPDFYLEVIAIDPQAAAPSRARWFGMDQLTADAAPRLAHWVARTDDIAAAASACLIDPGVIEPMSRGQLQWQITIAADGQLACDGVMPSLIQWQSQPHPALALPDSGCRLLHLDGRHIRGAEVAQSQGAIGLDDARIRIAPGDSSGLTASIMTPHGLRRLG